MGQYFASEANVTDMGDMYYIDPQMTDDTNTTQI